MFRTATIQYKATALPEDNRQKILGLCEAAVKREAKVIVFPEMSLTGYLWPDKKSLSRFAETATGESFCVFSEFCRENECYLSYGFAEKEGGGLFDWVFGTGRKKGRRLTAGQRAAREVTRRSADEIGATLGRQFGGKTGEALGRSIMRGVLGGILR